MLNHLLLVSTTYDLLCLSEINEKDDYDSFVTLQSRCQIRFAQVCCVLNLYAHQITGYAWVVWVQCWLIRDENEI